MLIFGIMTRYVAIIGLLLVASCRPDVFPPKPQGYFRLDTPATHAYRLFDRPGFPYTFEYPAYSTITDDTTYQGNKEKNPYWINIMIDGMNGVINITYKEITERSPLAKLNDDSYGLTFVHHEKTDGIETREFDNHTGAAGILYIVGGNTASRYQFTATDSTRHFMRGALYFDVTPNADSLKPVNDFLEKDIEHLLMTLRWR